MQNHVRTQMGDEMSTDAQRAANRRNSKKSTGPRSPEGKDAVRFNPLRHGLAGRHIIVNTGDGAESAEGHDALVEELRESLQAEGRMELTLVEKIAFAHLQWQRATRLEGGALQRRMIELDDLKRQQMTADEHAVRRDLWALRRGDEDPCSELALVKGEASTSERREQFRAIVSQRLRLSVPGLRHLAGTVEATIDELTRRHTLAESTVETLAQEFACEDPSLIARITEVTHTRPGSSAFSRGTEKAVVQILRTELEDLTRALATLLNRQAELESVARAEASLPGDDDLKRLQRYVSMHERQMARALTQLERLQRRRRGEASLPPISINLEAGG
jgi:hypothetical protein